MDEQLRDSLVEYLNVKGISRGQLSMELGYKSKSIASAYISGKYNGDLVEMEKRIKNWLSRQSSRSELLHCPVIPTEIMQMIHSACDIAYDEQDISLITGYAGNGKTTALEQYVKISPNAVYILANKSTSMHVLTQILAESFRLSTKGNGSAITRRIIEYLKTHDVLVIIDQADDLSDKSLEYLRQVVNDEGSSGLVLCGLPRLRNTIVYSHGDHDQLVSRIGLSVELPQVDIGDLEDIVKAVWPNLDRKTVEEFVTNACIRNRTDIRPSHRRLDKIMKRTNRVMLKNRASVPTVEMVKEASKYILRIDQ